MGEEKKTVIVIDDEDMLRSLTCDIIAGEGFEVLPASNGREAIEIFKERGGDIGLALLDMSMPEMDGKQTFDALRDLDPDLKIYVLSGFTNDPLVNKLVERGAIGVIPKPFKVEDLVEKVKEGMRKKQED